jgi:hypothetical protein
MEGTKSKGPGPREEHEEVTSRSRPTPAPAAAFLKPDRKLRTPSRFDATVESPRRISPPGGPDPLDQKSGLLAVGMRASRSE